MDKRFWGFIIVIVLVFSGILIYSNKKDESSNKTQPTNHIMGENKKLTLVEYGDFQCPACSSYYPVVTEVIEKYKDTMAFQFRHLPLTQIHNNAFAASRAAEAAGKQGKFWEMYDLLYQNQDAWSEEGNPKPMFEDYATELKLDTDKFRTDYSAKSTNDAINADIAAFKKTGAAMQTPTFFLDGKRIDVKADITTFEKAIDEALKNKQ